MQNFFHERRIAIEFDPAHSGGLLHLGRLNYEKARGPLGRHRHPGAMELCYLARGGQTYVVGEKPFRLKPGDVFAAFPDEEHSSGGAPEEKSILYWLVVDLRPRRGPFLFLPTAEGKRLRTALARLPSRHFPGGRDLLAPLDAAIAARRTGGDWSTLLARQHLTEFLTRVVERATQNAETPGGVSAPIATALSAIDRSVGQPVTLTELAKAAGLSLSRFKARFKREMGIPPREHILRQTIRRAETLLRDPRRSVTDVAYDLGFSSSQYFATVFRRFTATTPRAFREAAARTRLRTPRRF